MRTQTLLTIATLTLAAWSARAAAIYQTINQNGASTLGWSTNIWGTPTNFPTAGNDYITTNLFFVRTPGLASPGTFAGNSLQVDAGGILWLKHSGGGAAFVNLKMNGGSIQFHGGLAAGASPLAGTMQVLSNSTFSSDQTGSNARDIWVQSPISGSSNLTVNMSPAGFGLILSGNNSGYSGNWNCTGGFILITNGTSNPLGSGSVNLANTGNSLIFNTTNNLTISNVLTGIGSLSKLNTNTLTLDGSNPSFGGTISVGSGALKVQSAAAISSALFITLNGGSLDASPMGGLDLNASVPQTLNCRGTIISNLTASSGNVLNFNLSTTTNDILNVTGGLTLNGNPTLNLTLAGYKNTGTYRLINYSGTIQGGGSFTLVPPVGSTANWGLDTSIPGQVNLTVTNSSNNELWTGASSTTWDTSSANWSGVSTVYADGDMVTFDDSSAVNTIDLTTLVYPKTMTVSNNTQKYTFIFSGVSTDGLLTKQGTNELVFASTNNNFTGPIDIRSGVLSIGAGGGFGFLGPNVGPVTNNGILRVNLTGGGQTFTNPISGSGSVEVIGGGVTVTMRGSNSYAGLTTIGDGCQLNITSATALGATNTGTLVLPNGRLGVASFVDSLTVPEPVTVSGTGIAAAPGALYVNTTSNNVTWAGPVTIAGDARFRAVNTFVRMNFSAPVVATNSALWCTVGGAVADTNSTMTFQNTLALGTGALSKDGQGSLALAGSTTCSLVTVSNGTLLINGVLNGGPVGVLTTGAVGGSGTSQGPVTVDAGGVITPGNSIGTLTVNNAVANSGTMYMEVNRTNSPNADRLVANSIFVDGTLTVANLGPDLQSGDTFDLFDGPITGTFTATNLPALSSTNLYWDLSLLSSQGVISVASSSLPPPPQPTITSPSYGGGNFSLQVVSQSGYSYVLETTPVLAPATWIPVQTNAGGGTLNFTIPVPPGTPKQFFRVSAY